VSQHGVDNARTFVDRVRAQTSMFKQSPDAAAALSTALTGVARTYGAVDDALADFFAPMAWARGMTPPRYRPPATGQLAAAVEVKRGHCMRIGQAYIA